MKIESNDFKVILLEEVASTNTYLRDEIVIGKLSQAVVSATRQTAGRGRFGREWKSPKGGLYISFSCPLSEYKLKPIFLSVASSIAAANIINRNFDVNCTIKWPNDLIIGGKKISGILSEYVKTPEIEPHVIIGIGINLNTKIILDSALYKATSISEETGKQIKISDFRNLLIDEVVLQWQKLKSDGIKPMIETWSKLSDTLGNQIEILGIKESIQGQAIKVNDDFELILDTGNKLVPISEGDCNKLKR